MKAELEQPSQPKDLQESKRANWRMPVREQAQLHAALLRRRMQRGIESNERDNRLVFVESAGDLGSLLFSQSAEYTPLGEPAE